MYLLWVVLVVCSNSTCYGSMEPVSMFMIEIHSVHLVKKFFLAISISRNGLLITLLKVNWDTRERQIYWMSSCTNFCINSWNTFDGNNFKGSLFPSFLIELVISGTLSKFYSTTLLI